MKSLIFLSWTPWKTSTIYFDSRVRSSISNGCLRRHFFRSEKFTETSVTGRTLNSLTEYHCKNGKWEAKDVEQRESNKCDLRGQDVVFGIPENVQTKRQDCDQKRSTSPRECRGSIQVRKFLQHTDFFLANFQNHTFHTFLPRVKLQYFHAVQNFRHHFNSLVFVFHLFHLTVSHFDRDPRVEGNHQEEDNKTS